MNGSRAFAAELLSALKEGVKSNTEVVWAVFPPALYIEQTERALKDSAVEFGVQNVYIDPKGAYTGEMSAEMVAEFGCHAVLVGHSERRTLFFEDDQTVAQKFQAVQRAGLTPVLCVGETQEQRESNQTQEVVLRQLSAVLELVGIQAFQKAVIAYEPVWAIGTGLTARPEQAQAVHQLIREHIAEKDKTIAESIRILYGGSVNSGNAEALFAMADIDGGLIGGASLKAEEFIKIGQLCKNSYCSSMS